MHTPDIVIKENFIPNPAELFYTLMQTVAWDERLKARKTASYGVSYDYSGIAYPQTPMHPELVPICNAINIELGFYPNNCLLNYYPDGTASMGYHSDSSEELAPGTGVAIVSLGAERSILYKNKKDRSIIFPYVLKSGALLFMSNQIQEDWLHAIPKQLGAGPRISITLRDSIK
jgi:alkylated DNA repair dioxygenase AlkB